MMAGRQLLFFGPLARGRYRFARRSETSRCHATDYALPVGRYESKKECVPALFLRETGEATRLVSRQIATGFRVER